MSLRNLLLLAAAFLIADAVPALVPTAIASVTVYVNRDSTSCSDSGPGTPATPYCTISAALAAHHAPGDSIIVLPGTYREQVDVPGSGTAGSPIALVARGDAAHPVVVDGADDFGDPALWTPYTDDVWLAASVTWNPAQVFADSARLAPFAGAPEALPAKSFVWQSGVGLFVNTGDDNPGSHRAAVGRRLYGFRMTGTQWYVVDGFTATHNEWAGILLTAAAGNVSVTHDSVTFAYRYGIQAEGCTSVLIGANVTSDNLSSGIALTSGTTGCTVQDNQSYRNSTPSLAAGIYDYGASGNVFQRNNLHDNAYTGLHLQLSSGLVSIQNRSWNNGADGFHDTGTTDAAHVGDVAYGNFRDGFRLDSGSTGASVSDCIGTTNGLVGSGYNLRVDATATGGLASDDNLFWNPTSRAPVRYVNTAYASLAAYAAATGQDTRSIQADPRFTDPGHGDLRLTYGSPAIDNANSGVANWPATDALGSPRVDDPASTNAGLGPVAYADRGALEYAPIPPPPPAIVYVSSSSTSCSDTGPGTAGTPYCTLSAALAAHHAPGDSILVLPGTYREQVDVPGAGLPGSPIALVARGDAAHPVVVDGADDFGNPALWTPYADDVWLAASVTWNPAQVFADSARLAPFAGAPEALPAKSFVWQSGVGLFVNTGDDNPGSRRAAVGRRLYGFRMTGTQWYVVDGFTVTRTEWAGILLTAAAGNVSVTHDSVTFAYRYGIQAEGCTSVLIGANVTSDNLSSGIALTSGTTGCTVQDNQSYRNSTPSLAAGIYDYGAPGNVFQRNNLHDNAYSGLHLQLSSGLVSIQNRSWNNGADGFHDTGTTGTAHVGDVAYGNFRDGFRLDSGAVGTSVSDCIAAVNGLIGGGYDLRVDATATNGLVSNDNLFWNPSGRAPVQYVATNYTSLSVFAAATGQDTRSIQADPRFTDPSHGDLRLTYGSPAIDNANSGVANWPATDALGSPRVDDPASANAGLGPVAYADRGALEYVPVAAPPTASVPRFDHVLVVVIENMSFNEARSTPYIGSLVAGYSSFADYYAITHPSQPNYFALWAGSTQGLASDDCPPPGSPYSGENLGHACEAAGLRWRAYSENLPATASTVCEAGPTPNGALYVRKHSPWVSFANLNHANERPYEQLAADIAADSLPNLAFVIPNGCHNAHNEGCPVDTADAWLAREMPAMLASVGPRGLVVLTWDEDDNEDGNRILTVFAGPLVRPGTVSRRFVNHYTTLRTICDGLGIAPFGAALAESSITDVWIPQTAGAPDPPRPGTRVASAGLGRPNPFRAATSFTLTLPSPTAVSAEVFDLAGRRVKTLGPVTLSGASEIRWDGSRDDGGAARPGVYLVRVRAGGALFTRRVVRLE